MAPGPLPWHGRGAAAAGAALGAIPVSCPRPSAPRGPAATRGAPAGPRRRRGLAPRPRVAVWAPLGVTDKPAVDSLAERLLLGLTTARGKPARWPAARPGQRYPPALKAARLLLEYLTGKNIVLEGVYKRTQLSAELPRVIASIAMSAQAAAARSSTSPVRPAVSGRRRRREAVGARAPERPRRAVRGASRSRLPRGRPHRGSARGCTQGESGEAQRSAGLRRGHSAADRDVGAEARRGHGAAAPRLKGHPG